MRLTLFILVCLMPEIFIHERKDAFIQYMGYWMIVMLALIKFVLTLKLFISNMNNSFKTNLS